MQLPEQDHYEIARDAALERLREGLDANRPAARQRLAILGAELFADGGSIVVPCMNWRFRVQLDPYGMELAPDGAQVAIMWQILVLNYLGAQSPEPPRGFRSFADFPEGRSYQAAFDGRVIGRLTRTVGGEADVFRSAIESSGATPTGHDPVVCIVRFFPLLEFQVSRYEGDEDFPTSCNVLLSDNVLSLFTMEDGIVAAERLISVLAGRTPAA